MNAKSPTEWVTGARFSQFVSWSGELIVGRSTFSLEGSGARDHAWGPRDWWSRSWEATSWTAGPDLAIRAEDGAGSLWRAGALRRLTRFVASTRWGNDALSAEATHAYEDEEGGALTAAVLPEVLVPIPVEARAGAPRPAVVLRGPARVDAGGRTGWGHVEYGNPAPLRS